MADIRPFCAIRYNPELIPDLSRVITQPYDKISPEMKQAYLAGHPHNFVRLILPDGPDRYQQSARLCRQWLNQGILIQDPKPAFYVYSQEFEQSGTRRTRLGVIGVTRVDEFEQGTVLPHERTLSKPKADRLKLTRASRKDYEQIFMLYDDPDRKVDALLSPGSDPDIKATDEYGVIHRVWTLSDPDAITRVRSLMQGKVLLIADGHHRYETALSFRQEMEAAEPGLPADAALRFKLCAFVNVADPGLVIFPTHRLIFDLPDLDWREKLAALRRCFELRAIPDNQAQAELDADRQGHAFVLHLGKGSTWLLQLSDPACVNNYVDPDRSQEYKDLDVTILHSVIIENVLGIRKGKTEDHVRYERDPDQALDRVDSGEFQACLLLNPTRVEQVQTLARKGERMPQKSTDFFPKLVSGLVLFDIGEGRTVQS